MTHKWGWGHDSVRNGQFEGKEVLEKLLLLGCRREAGGDVQTRKTRARPHAPSSLNGERSPALAQAAKAKCHRLGGFHNRNVFLTVVGTERSKFKVPARLVPGESSLPGLQKATSFLGPHVVKRDLTGAAS